MKMRHMCALTHEKANVPWLLLKMEQKEMHGNHYDPDLMSVELGGSRERIIFKSWSWC